MSGNHPTRVMRPRSTARNDALLANLVAIAYGALWGCLIGLIFFVPLFGAAIGAASALTDRGVDDNFMKER